MIVIKIQAGLGNQLFQYATARALSLKLNTELKVDITFYNEAKNRNAYRLDKFNLPISVANETEIQSIKNRTNIPFLFKVLKSFGIKVSPYYKKTHIFDGTINSMRILSNNTFHNYYLDGWFGNEKYFIEFSDIIKSDILSNLELKISNQSLIKNIKENNSVAVHIRRGDYLTNNYFHVLPKEYYIKAINVISRKIKNPVFYFFSNDPDWVKKEFSNITNAKFIEHNSVADTDFSTNGDIADLVLIKECRHQIIANSTFSWWGAWLNQNPTKIVIAPKKWFDNLQAQKEYESSDFIPKEWIKI